MRPVEYTLSLFTHNGDPRRVKREKRGIKMLSEEIKFPLKKETGNHVWESEVHNKMNTKRPIPAYYNLHGEN